MKNKSLNIHELKRISISDLISGFLVFLISLPLVLGIAMASGFPPIAGIFSAIIGGVILSFFYGSNLSIRGPSAALIVIVYGSVLVLGKGDLWLGYKLTLAVIVVSGIIQMLLGIFRAEFLAFFFPSSVVYGLFAAIGLLIITKQFHTLIGVSADASGFFEMISEIPQSLININPEIAFIGLLSLAVLFGLDWIKNKNVKKAPAPMLVVLIAIPLGYLFDLEHSHKYLFSGVDFKIGPKDLVSLPSNILEGIEYPDFTHVFSLESLYFIIMFALVGSIESIYASKAIDLLDPYKRKSNLNNDIFAVGLGNTISGLIGGLPMITTFQRSASNIRNGAKSSWSNFFQGFFLFLFAVLFPWLIHHIPLAALAAILIHTGYKLASPKVFFETYKVGREQLLIFITTMLMTLMVDVITGIFSGIVIKIFIHLYHGAPLRSLVKSTIKVLKSDLNTYTIRISDAAIFSNYLGIKKNLDNLPSGNKIVIDFSEAKLIDHTTMEHLHHYSEDYINAGGDLNIKGLEGFTSLSFHPLSYRVKNKKFIANTHVPRSKQLKSFARSVNFSYRESFPAIRSNFGKFSPLNISVKYEGNIMIGKIGDLVYSISDLSLVGSGSMKAQISQITALSISNLHLGIPIFTLEKEGLIDKIMEKAFFNDIDFERFPEFSKKYKLKGIHENAIRNFFTEEIIRFFEQNEIYNVESLGAEVIIYKTGNIIKVEEIRQLFEYGKNLITVIEKRSEKSEQETIKKI